MQWTAFCKSFVKVHEGLAAALPHIESGRQQITLEHVVLSWTRKAENRPCIKGLWLIRCAGCTDEWRKEIHQPWDARLFRDRPPQSWGN